MTPSTPHLAGLQIGWGAIFGLLNLLLGGGVVATWIKNRPKMRELAQSADARMREDLIERVNTVERQLETERAARAQDRVEHEAQLSVMRHELGNVRANFEALLLLIEAAPDKAADHVARIRKTMAEREAVIAHEKAAIHGAKIMAAGSLPTS